MSQDRVQFRPFKSKPTEGARDHEHNVCLVFMVSLPTHIGEIRGGGGGGGGGRGCIF